MPRVLGMTVWWSQFQELLFSASPRSSTVTSARKRSRGAEYLCDVIYDRSANRCAGAAIHDLGGVINLATSTPVKGCDLRRVGAHL